MKSLATNKYAAIGLGWLALLVNPLGATPSISLTNTPPVALVAGSSYTNVPQATGFSSSWLLTGVSIDIYQNGSWSPWAYAGGGNGYANHNFGNTFVPQAGSLYQFRAWATESGGTNSAYAYSPLYSVPSASWTSYQDPNSVVHIAPGNIQSPTATGYDPGHGLSAVLIDVSVDGGSWTAFAYAGAAMARTQRTMAIRTPPLPAIAINSASGRKIREAPPRNIFCRAFTARPNPRWGTFAKPAATAPPLLRR